jgi:hypothetical protein
MDDELPACEAAVNSCITWQPSAASRGSHVAGIGLDDKLLNFNAQLATFLR